MSELNKSITSQLGLLFYPELIESSRIVSCFNDKFEAKLKQLITIKEVSNLIKSESELESYLKQFDFIEITNNETIKVNISDKLHLFSLVNIPISCNESLLLKSLQIDNSHFIRLYKKSIFWNIVTDNVDNANLIEEKIKNATIENLESKLKYDKLTKVEISSNLSKQISLNSYNKETSGLQGNYDNGKNSDNNSKLAWRKKSGDTNEESFSRKGFNRGNNNSNNANVFQRGSFCNTNVRDRFNSEGNNNSKFFKPEKKLEEIEIDLSKISYSLKIKNKYTNNELVALYDQCRYAKVFDSAPKWDNEISEVCTEVKKKEIHLTKKERSMTFTSAVPIKNKFDEVKLNINAVPFKLPSNHPLSGGSFGNTGGNIMINPSITSTGNSNGYKGEKKSSFNKFDS